MVVGGITHTNNNQHHVYPLFSTRNYRHQPTPPTPPLSNRQQHRQLLLQQATTIAIRGGGGGGSSSTSSDNRDAGGGFVDGLVDGFHSSMIVPVGYIGGFLMAGISQYSHALEQSPIRTKSITAALIFMISDIVAQRIEKNRSDGDGGGYDLDRKRTLAASLLLRLARTLMVHSRCTAPSTWMSRGPMSRSCIAFSLVMLMIARAT